MKKTVALIVLALCLALVSCGHSEKLTTAKGQELVILANEQRYIAVSYWAVWCTSCKKEVAAMNELKQQFARRLIVLGVDFDGKRGKQLLESMHKLNILYPVVVSDIATQWHLPMPQVLPTTYLLSPKHQIVKTFYGENTAEELKKWLASQLSDSR